MRPHFLAAIASVSLLGVLATSPARAQALRPIGSTGVSPYLNLIRPGGSPAINYFGLVRPQLTYNAAINSLEQQVALSRVAVTAQESLAVPTTGHVVSFLNTRGYFLNLGAQVPFQNVGATAGAGAAGVGAGGTTAPYGTSAGARAASNLTSGAFTVPTAPTANTYRRY